MDRASTARGNLGHAGAVTGTLINVGTVLAGTAIGIAGRRRACPTAMQQRVLAGLGLVTLVIGVDSALAWSHTNPLYVLGGVLLGGVIGEAVGIERALARLGDRLQRAVSGDEHSRVAEGFVTASLLFCVGPLTVLGSIEDGLTGHYTQLATKSVLDGFASIALAATLGWGVALAAVTVLVDPGSRSRSARARSTDVLAGEALARAHQRRRDPDHRDLAQAARPQGREGRQLPAGAGDHAADRGDRLAVLTRPIRRGVLPFTGSARKKQDTSPVCSPQGWIFSPRSSMATNLSIRRARVSGRLASWMRCRTA